MLYDLIWILYLEFSLQNFCFLLTIGLKRSTTYIKLHISLIEFYCIFIISHCNVLNLIVKEVSKIIKSKIPLRYSVQNLCLDLVSCRVSSEAVCFRFSCENKMPPKTVKSRKKNSLEYHYITGGKILLSFTPVKTL